MKVRVRSFNGSLPEYLSEGKVYKVVCFCENEEKHPCILADNNRHIVLLLKHCGHLKGGSWEIVK